MTNTPTSSARNTILLTALAPLIWGSTYIVTTEWLPPDRPFTAAVLRCLPAGLLLVLACRQAPARAEWGRLAVLAALNIGFFQALLFVAAYRLPGGLAAVVGAVQPILVMAMAWALDGRWPGAVALGAGVLGVLGMAALLLSPTMTWDGIGLGAALAGAACMAAGTFLARRWRTGLPLLAFTGWQLLIGGLVLVPLAWWVDPPLPALNGRHALGYAYLSLVGTLLSYALWFRGVYQLSPVAVSSLSLLSPLSAVLLGWAVLNQSLGGLALLGFAMVLTSILAVQKASHSSTSQP
ncbi:EamA family transporter [Roseateles albus]|uniref:EamA family transporter n=1 Tax=Roseateles albus TaxID=2987525 RepID=A0ABT5KI12_9BURK|nr:EamA family transporter [Roseateles albus]MDC8773027.1 EamA family transporter [Roseateles albus]